MQELLSTAQATLRTSPGMSLTALGRAMEQAGYRDLPPATLRALRAALAETPTLPLAPQPGGPAVDTADGDDEHPSPEPPSEAAAALQAAQPSADQAPSPAAQQPEPEAAVDPEVPSPEPPPAVPTPPAEQPDAAMDAAVEVLPAPAVLQRTPLRYAGLALVLPIL